MRLENTIASRPANGSPSSNSSAPSTSLRNGRLFTTRAAGPASQAFFPRVPELFANIRRAIRKLCVCRPAPSSLTASQQAIRKTYDNFRKYESEMRTAVLDTYQSHFRNLDFSAAKIKSLHRQFGRSLADCFPEHLRQSRPAHTDLATALSEAYRSAIDHLLRDHECYPKGYLDTMKGPLQGLVSTLASGLSPQPDWPARAERISADHQFKRIPTTQTRLAASSNYYDHVKKTRYEICAEIMDEHNASLRSIAIGQVNPENAIRNFEETYNDAFLERSFHLSPADKNSPSALLAAHNEAMESAVADAVDAGFFCGEVPFHDLKAFRSTLNAICDQINREIEPYGPLTKSGI